MKHKYIEIETTKTNLKIFIDISKINFIIDCKTYSEIYMFNSHIICCKNLYDSLKKILNE